MKGYITRIDGEEFEIPLTWKMRCCDCSLVHWMYFRIKGGRLFLTPKRDQHATAASRRHKRNETKTIRKTGKSR